MNNNYSIWKIDPRKDQDNDVIKFNLAADHLIYNTKELSELLSLPCSDNCSDYDYLELGFAKFREDFFKDVSGSFIFLNLDKPNRTLTIATGSDPSDEIFYWTDKGTIYLSTQLKGLLQLAGIPKETDYERIVSILNCLPLDPYSTCYRNIKRLPHGHVLAYNSSEVKLTRYWRYEDIKDLNLRSDAEYLERFLELYREAVGSRIAPGRKVGISLSGGLDSGTVAILASEILANRGENLYSYTSIPSYETSTFLEKTHFGDESNFTGLLCNKYPNIYCQLLDSKDVSPVDGIIGYLEIVCQPMHASGNLFWLYDLRHKAMKDNIQTLLTGAQGNMSVSFSGFKNEPKRVFELVRNFKYLKIYSGEGIVKCLTSLLIPVMIRNILWKHNSVPTQQDKLWKDFSAINPHFAEKMGIADIQPFSQKRDRSTHPQKLMFDNSFSGIGAGSDRYWRENFGINIVDPSYDKKLLEFCFGIPNRQFVNCGMRKFLIRRAFHDKMPGEILWNKKIGRQAADISLRVKSEYDRVNNILNRFRRSDTVREVLDINKMSDVLNRTLSEKSPAIAKQTSSILLRGLMVGLFLLKQEGNISDYDGI